MTPASRQRQINASKTKEMQAKKLAFPWIPLAESGLFNGLQRIQIKKSFPASHCGSNITNRVSRSSVLAPLGQREARALSGEKNNIYHIFSFSASECAKISSARARP